MHTAGVWGCLASHPGSEWPLVFQMHTAGVWGHLTSCPGSEGPSSFGCTLLEFWGALHPVEAVRAPRLLDAHCWSLGAPHPRAPPACVEPGAPRAPSSGRPCHSRLRQEGLLWAHHEGRGFLPGSEARELSCLFRPAESRACLALRRCLSAAPRLNPSLCPPHTQAPLRFLPLASRVSFSKSSVSRDRQSHYCHNRRQSAGEIQAFIPTLKFSLEVG